MGEGRNDKFYNKDWFMWLSLFLFAPLGIFLLWKRDRYNAFSRVALSLLFGLMFLIPFSTYRGYGNRVAENNTQAQRDFARVGWNNPNYNVRRWTFNWGARTTPRTNVVATPAPRTQINQPTSPAQNPPTNPAQNQPTNPAQNPPTQTLGTNWKALQDRIFQLTNAERQKNGLAPLNYNADVEKYAVAKSQDMAQNNYFDHRSPTNGYFYDIWKRDGFRYSAGAENIYTMNDARGFGDRDVNSLAQSIVNGWMSSEGHRKNILNTTVKNLGVGVAEKDNRLYATQIFHAG